MATDSLIGTLLAGRFRIEALLGRGGMGSVYLAQHVALQRRVAVKVIRKELLSDVSISARFRREARAASRIDHPNVPRILDFGQAEDGRLYLAMERVEGPTLAQVLREEGPLALARVLGFLIQIADALQSAHSVHVIHRDLKPSNIVVTHPPGREEQIKVLDFGLAKIMGLAATMGLTAQGDVFGTPEYLAPERCQDGPDDPRSDLYSLGIVGFELLAGRVPWTGRIAQVIASHITEVPPAPSTASPRGDITPSLDALILRCLAKKLDDRFQTGAALGAALREQLGELHAPQGPFASPLRRQSTVPYGQVVPLPVPGLPPREPFGPGDTVMTPAPRLVDPTADATRVDALEDLAFALRDRGVGTPEITEHLAALVEAGDRLAWLELRIHSRTRDGEELEAMGQHSESRLSRMLGQLEHERSQGVGLLGASAQRLTDRATAIRERIRETTFEVSRRQDVLADQLSADREKLETACRAVLEQSVRLRAHLRRIRVELQENMDPELRELLDHAGV
jgi:tRNA A-37 threonylcarbamoyl transferase component Bud32